MSRRFILGLVLFAGLLAFGGSAVRAGAAAETFDVVVYGSTPAAITAAIEAKELGKRVVIISPETRIGGLTTGGLGQTDIGNKSAFGGACAVLLSRDREVLRRRSALDAGEER